MPRRCLYTSMLAILSGPINLINIVFSSLEWRVKDIHFHLILASLQEFFFLRLLVAAHNLNALFAKTLPVI